MPNFRKGGTAILETTTTFDSSRPQFIQWGQEEKKFIQFITPLEEIPRVKMHQFIITGTRDDGSKIYNDFVSRRDAGLDGADGYDPIWTRFDMPPKDRCVAAAVCLNPLRNSDNKISGWEVATKTNKRGESSPEVGIIVQHSGNFFSWLATFESDTGTAIQDCVFSVTRRGEKISTRYDFIKTDLPPLPSSAFSDSIPDIDEYLVGLADEQRMRKLIDPLPDGWRLSQYMPDKTAAARQTPLEQDAPWDDEEAPKNAKFSALRARIEEVNE